MVRDFYEMPGVSVATGSTISYAPFIFVVKGLQKKSLVSTNSMLIQIPFKSALVCLEIPWLSV